MARIVQLRMPESERLLDMAPEEIERLVEEHADRALENLPEGIRPVGVNAVSLDALRPGTSGEFGVWAEWTRACCGKRDLIDEFEEPVIEDFSSPVARVHEGVRGTHVESVFRKVTLENPKMHS
ncbi:MAG TPA: hypothetical protein VNQ77_13600 [Frankiaceae bacterium]|nr:hypothetical protein [Frankiaceae bacterium]